MEAQQQSLKPHEIIDIKSIIQFGTRAPELFQIPFYLSKFNKKIAVKIRGLSNYEFDEINVEMYSEIKDTKTLDYVFNGSNENEQTSTTENETDIGAVFSSEQDLQESLNEVIIEPEKEIDKDDTSDLPSDVNHASIVKAFLLRKVFVVFHAMKDFYPDLTIEQVKQIEGLNEIYKRVNEKSGKTAKVQEQIEFFREQQQEQ
jgi:hypothetical protein